MDMDSSDEENLLLAVVAIDEDRKKRSRKRRKIWVHEINSKREVYGEFYTLVPDFLKDEKRFYINFRMTIKSYDHILNLIRHDITKQFSNWRSPIPPEERFAITLRYLATGDSLLTIAHSYRVGFSTITQIITEVCEAIWNNLKTHYMPEVTQLRWESIAKRFEEKWRFPNCIGAIDGKHVTVKCPDNAGSMYFSYLKKHSVVLLAVVGPEYEFICVDVGGYGKNSDGGIFEESIIGQRFNRGEFNLPNDKPLPGQREASPHVLVGDQAFALSPYLLRPFPYEQSRDDSRKDKFNNRLGKARRVVENAFGILTMKFRIFLRPIEMQINRIPLLVGASCLLHNFLRFERVDEEYNRALLAAFPITEGEMIPLQPLISHRGPPTAHHIRENFADYFNNLL